MSAEQIMQEIKHLILKDQYSIFWELKRQLDISEEDILLDVYDQNKNLYKKGNLIARNAKELSEHLNIIS